MNRFLLLFSVFLISFSPYLHAQTKDDQSRLEANAFLIQAMTRAFQQDYAEAIELYQKALNALPNNPEAAIFAGLTEANAALNNFTAAVFYAREMVKLAPENAEYVQILAYAQQKSGDSRGAVETLRTYLDKFPKPISLWQDLAEYQLKAMDFRGALATAEKMQELRPESVIIALKRMELYEKNGEWQKLIPLLEQRIAAEPENVDLRFKLQEAHRKTGRISTDSASSVSITVAPSGNAATVAQLKVAFENGLNAAQMAQTLSVLNQVLTQEPNHTDAMLLKGKVLFLQRQFLEAGTLLQTALRKNPRDLAAWAMAVQAFTQAGNAQQALAVADEAEFLFIGQPILMLAKVETLIALGKNPEAKTLLAETQVIIGSDFPNDAKLKTQLEALKSKI